MASIYSEYDLLSFENEANTKDKSIVKFEVFFSVYIDLLYLILVVKVMNFAVATETNRLLTFSNYLHTRKIFCC